MSMRWKVLIADDEPIIREGIRDAVDWDALQMEVVAEAEDGEEALELAVRHGVHVLLVDLNMPIMNGMTLIKHVREQNDQCRIVIITGHDEFAYAQEAIRLHVDDYILKPANPAQLQQVLGQIRRQLEETISQEQHAALASKQLSKNIPLLRERFCLEWLEGALQAEEIAEQQRFLQLPSGAPSGIAVIRWPEARAVQPLYSEKDRELLLYAIENIVSELLAGQTSIIVRDAHQLVVVILWSEVAEEVWEKLEQAVQAFLKLTVFVGFERLAGERDKLADAYCSCKASVYKETPLSPMVRRARQLLQEKYADRGLTLESLAEALQVSPVYLSRTMKQELGVSFVALLTQLRIRKAIQLLNATELPIVEIAARVGYDTQHYFSTAFKKAVGVSPAQYRKGAAFAGGSGLDREG
ncbi:response regulator [Paenibacillus turpanensis]|uniref:response regulator n=1 Tax=Paenibacillus turpanensis TaxID=2689078 RepID=UPI00140E41B9|nr:response regulator [Paenibacillus turpanensis]